MSCESPFKTITTSGTTITSPNYPEKYPNNAKCKIRILFHESPKVGILFQSFDVEECYERNCDWLNIQDENSSESNLVDSKLCGNTVPDPIVVNRNSAILDFHTDRSIAHTGFKMIAYAIGNITLFVHRCMLLSLMIRYNSGQI